MRSDLPTGTVTFLFTDVEGSTRLLHELGAEAYAEALAEHRHLIREACASQAGVEVDTQGDAFFFAFPTAPGAIAAAGVFTESLASGPVQVRVGLHTGTPLLTEEGYVGADVHRAARIAAAGHGGQVLISASTASLVEIELTDLGEHRLKDLSASERIYQLANGDYPPLKTLYRTNLPVPATPFLGRERELAQVVELLTQDGVRLLTLTGPGGTGKTRLALQAAAEASESFPDGIFWVPLAPLREPGLVLSTLARTLTVSEEQGRPLEDTLAAHLSGKRLLLLLDNVEHLLPQVAERIAALRASNGSQLLVTSRERLRIGGEQTWPVPPLAEDDGVALFAARARAIDPGFIQTPAVEELCARLDELPLAIELAAARTAVFSAEQLLERLSQRLDLLKGDRDADPRQQTLRATIEWSHGLLSEEEHRLFRRLAVFVGGCTYEAAEEVAGADPDNLQSLLDKSLLRKRHTDTEPRYWMLETIREYAIERLEETGEANELARRHAEHFLAVAEEAEPHLLAGREVWVERLETDHDNLRAACDRFERTAEKTLRLRLVGSIWRFWYLHGHLTEGQRRLESVLATDTPPTPARGKALTGAGVLALSLMQLERARLLVEESLDLYRQLGDSWGTACAEMLAGQVLALEGDLEGAQRRLADSRRLFLEVDDKHYAGIATSNLAWVTADLGDKEGGRALHQEALAIARALGTRGLEAYAIGELAILAGDEGRLTDAAEMLRQAIRMVDEMGERLHLATNLAGLANILAMQGQARRAAQVLASSERLMADLGAMPDPGALERNAKTLDFVRAELDDESFEEAWQRGRQLTVKGAVELALANSLEEPT